LYLADTGRKEENVFRRFVLVIEESNILPGKDQNFAARNLGT
jgi:hypothetical protein